MNKKGIGYYIIVVGIMYIISAVILSVAAMVIWKTNASAVAVSSVVIMTYVVSNFIGGFLVGKKTEKNRFLWGIIISAVYFLIIILGGVWFMKDKISFNPQIVGNALICIVSGMFGGMLAMPGK